MHPNNNAIKHDISEFSYVSFEATLPVWCRWLDIGNRQAHTSNNSGVFVFLKKGALVARVWSSWADIRNTHHTHTGTSFAPFFSLRRKKSNVWFVRSCDHLIALKQEIQLWAGRSLNWSICSDLTPMSHPYTIASPIQSPPPRTWGKWQIECPTSLTHYTHHLLPTNFSTYHFGIISTPQNYLLLMFFSSPSYTYPKQV